MGQREQEWLDHWANLIGEPLVSIERSGMVLTDLRRDRKKLVDALSIFPYSEAITRRYVELLDWSGEGPGCREMHMLLCEPDPASDARLRDLVLSYRSFVSTIEDHVSSDGSSDLVARHRDPLKHYLADFDTERLLTPIDDVLQGWFADDAYADSEPGVEEAVHFLMDPLYFLACDYGLSHYVLFGLVEHRIDRDPFRPLVELWRHGSHAAFLNDPDAEDPTELDAICIYAPEQSSD
ncbi:MAG: hypothetical protein IID33_13895 [Planctomycetes bacterium]|nr:hypothetical protein [Planctomycetota bacterium]